jgi:hypothetical protein
MESHIALNVAARLDSFLDLFTGRPLFLASLAARLCEAVVCLALSCGPFCFLPTHESFSIFNVDSLA